MSKVAKLMEVPRFLDEGGFGLKVRILRMINICAIVNFAWKKSKPTSKKDKQVQWLVEALACPISHLGVIKFWESTSKQWKLIHGGGM